MEQQKDIEKENININTNSSIKLNTNQKFLDEIKEEAIPLIIFDTPTKKFHLNSDAENILSKIKGPIGVISVAGMYRTGKSYLLNRMLLNRSNGFSVGPSINPCTKGLWIWSNPIKGFSDEGVPLNIFVIDTEGIGATDEDQNHDSKIFTLGLLLSSYFIYNSLNSIDENAIQNLSFIVNISKNIQLSAKQKNSEAKDLSLYLPNFLWVIRDFALKLINTDGEQITSKEYLEKSLEEQKGNSESIASKNKIRKLLKDFFADRNCLTLVRPLTSEENLQNLDKMELSQLRPEFSQQVTNLRKMVLNKMKPKTLNGQELNGEMFCTMTKCYIEAINAGAVPVIENAWSFVCKNECLKAMKNASEIYNKKMTEGLNSSAKKTSFEEEEFLKMHKEAKEKSIENYKRFAIGNFFDEFLKKLKEEIYEKFMEFKTHNEKEGEKNCVNFLIKNYNDIDKNIKSGNYKNPTDFNADIEDFIEFYKKSGPQGPKKDSILLNFIVKNILEASEAFIRQNKNESDIQKSTDLEKINKLNNDFKDLKDELEKEINSKNDLMKKFEKEKKELLSVEKNTKENLALLEKENEQSIKHFNEKYENLKKENEKKINELKEKLNTSEENLLETERKSSTKDAEFLKQKSLLDQKLKFCEKQIEELTHKEKDHSSELKNIMKEKELFTKDSKEKYEQHIKTLNLKMEDLQDKNIDLETKLLDKEKRWGLEKLKNDENISEFKKKIEDLTELLNTNEEDFKQKEKNKLNEIEKNKTELLFKIEEYKIKNEEIDNKCKENEEKYQNLKIKTNKEISILQQKLELTQSSLNEFKIQAEEEKNTLQAMINLLEDKNQNSMQSQEDYIKQITEFKNNYFKDIKKIEEENESTRNRLNTELEEYKNKFFNEKNEKNFSNENYEKILKQNEEKISFLEKNNEENLEKIKKLEENFAQFESNSKLDIEKLEENSHNKIEEMLKNTRIEIEENNNKNEKLINEMQKYFEAEKNNLDIKLFEEKEKFLKKLNEQEKYYIEKYEEIEEGKNKKISDLEEDLENLETQHNEYLIHTNQEILLNKQNIEYLQKFLNEQKENFTNLQNSQKFNLEKQLENYNKEKEILNEKIEILISNVNKLEKEITVLEVQKEYLENDLKSSNEKIDNLLKNFNEEKNQMKKKIDNFEEKYQKIYDEILIKNGEFSRENALKIQEIEFLEKKLTELQNHVDMLNSKNEENLKNYKENLELEYSETIIKLNTDKEELENKLLLKKREIKEIEADYSKDKFHFEKELAVLNEKLADMNTAKDELLDSIEKERDLHKKNIEEVKENNKIENSMKIKENDFLKKKLNKIEEDNNELMSNYDKDRELWSSKNKFLEEKLAKNKFDLTESNKKYESIIQLLEKQGSTEKEKFDVWQNVITSQVENRYTEQIKQFKENYQKAYEEISQRKNYLENEIKILQEKIQNEQKNKLLDQSEIGKKLKVSLENEQNLKAQFTEILNQKDSKIMDLNNLIKKEKENFKNKIIELEDKCREYENKRMNLANDNLKEKVVFDKDKGGYKIEIDNLKEKIIQNERLILKYTSENKDLIKENDKLKRDQRNIRSTNFIPKFSRYATNSKDSRNPNTSFDRSTDGIDFMKNLSTQNINLLKNKFGTKSEKSEEENISSLSNLNI